VALARQTRSFERQSDGYTYFVLGMDGSELSMRATFQSNFAKYLKLNIKQRDRLSRRYGMHSQRVLENHPPNKGYSHRFTLDESKPGNFQCTVCLEKYSKHE
jgi:hypothetical protein